MVDYLQIIYASYNYAIKKKLISNNFNVSNLQQGDKIKMTLEQYLKMFPNGSDKIKCKILCDYCRKPVFVATSNLMRSLKKYPKTACKKCTLIKRNEMLCSQGKSLGDKYPELIKYWSNKNEKTPFQYLPGSNSKVWWKCENNLHPHHLCTINNKVNNSSNCPYCSDYAKKVCFENSIAKTHTYILDE